MVIGWFEIFYFLMTVANLVSSLVCFYYYYRTKIVEYLLFSIIFLGGMYWAATPIITYYLEGNTVTTIFYMRAPEDVFLRIIHFLGGITVQTNNLFVIIYFSRAVTRSTPKRLIGFTLLVYHLCVFIYLPILFGKLSFFNWSYNEVVFARLISFSLLISIVGVFFLIKVLPETKNIYAPSESEMQIRLFWRIIVIATIIFSFSWVTKGIVGFTNLVTGEEIVMFDYLFYLSLSSLLFAYGIPMYLGLRKPGGFLVFQYQLVKAKEMYIKMENEAFLPNKFGINQIRTYLEKIPQHVFEIDAPRLS